MFVIFVFVGELLILSLLLVQARGMRVVRSYVQTVLLLLPLGQIRLIFANRGEKNLVIVYLMVMSVHRLSADTESAAVNELGIMVEALLWSSSIGFGIILVFLLNVSDRSNQKVHTTVTTSTHNPPIMASPPSASNWECGACASFNEGGKYCSMCATPCPKH